MEMTVRELIEHLAQFDQDLKVKVRDGDRWASKVRSIDEGMVKIEEYVDSPTINPPPSAAQIRDMLRDGTAQIIDVVLIG